MFENSLFRVSRRELLGRLEIRVGFGNGHQPAERALQLRLRALVGAQGSGIIDIHSYFRRVRAGIDDILER